MSPSPFLSGPSGPGIVSPVVPTSSATGRLRPIGLSGNRISAGFWAERRRLNHDVTIPHGAAQLEAVGNLGNFRLATSARGVTSSLADRYAGGHDDSGRPFAFLDSDVHKWLEAVGWEIAQRPDPALMHLAEPIVQLVATAQREDGYLNTYFQVAQRGREFTDLQWGHELYTTGHLVQAAIAWHRGIGDDRLLRVAERAVDRVWAELGPDGRQLIDGHPEIEMALVELYRTTGRERHLELARTLVDRRGYGLLGRGRFGSRYWQDNEPVRVSPVPVGHAVRQVYLDCGVVDLAVETGDRELLDAAIVRWEAMVGSRTYLTGALGSRHRDESFGDAFELPPDRAYAETCAAIGSVMLSWRLLLATGESRFADLIERTAFNAVLPGLGLDGAHFFYTNPLQRRSGGAEVVDGAAVTRRAPWFACACCPPNLMRFLATMPDLVATTSQRGIQLHQLATGTIDASMGGTEAQLEVATEYPWDGNVEIGISNSVGEPWTLSVRVPSWCHHVSASVNGADVEVAASPGTLDVSRAWRAGDRVRLCLEMPPRVTLPDPRIDALRGTAALERGPLVYAIEQADLPAGVATEDIEIAPDPQLDPVTTAAEQDLGGLVSLRLDATTTAAPVSAGWPYREATEKAAGVRSVDDSAVEGSARSMVIRAIPYFAWGNQAGTGMRVWLPIRTGQEGPDGSS